MLVQPDGWNRYFGRDSASDTDLRGDGGWAAELKGNVFTAWASCGWKLNYVNGKISSMVSPDNRKFDWIRSGERVTEIREGGASRLAVKWNDAGSEMVGIESGGEKFAFVRDEKPRIQAIAKQNIVSTIDKSLTRITLPDGTSKTYHFGLDEQLNPNLKLVDRVLTWDSETKHIISDDDWKYKITPADDGGYAAIGRSSGKGKEEFWHNDRNKGIEIVQGLDGVKRVTTVFPNGKFAGKLRKREEYLQGVKQSTFQRSYSETGQLIREDNLDSQNRIIASIEYIYDIHGRLAWLIRLNGECTKYDYTDSKKTAIKFQGKKVLWSKTFDSSGQVVEMLIPEFPGINFSNFEMEKRNAEVLPREFVSQTFKKTQQ